MPSSTEEYQEPPLQQQRRSPPPPPPPTALTPGPRASNFTTLWEQALATTLRTISYDTFAACFPTIAAHAPDSLRGMHRSMVERLETFAKTDFQSILAERSVVSNLNALDALIAEASARRKSHAHSPSNPPAQPHLFPPSALLAAHLAPVLTHEQSQLNARLQTLQSQNARLSRTVTTQREEIAALLEGVVAAVQDLQGAVEGMHGTEGDGTVEQLAAETSEVEREMRTIMADY